MEPPVGTAGESRRVSVARQRAAERVRRQRDVLRPLGWTVIAVVAAGALSGDPAPAVHGKGLGVIVATVLFAAMMARALGKSFAERPQAQQAAVIIVSGAAGVAIAALQPHGATELAAGTAVWMAVARLTPALGVTIAFLITVAVDVAATAAGTSSAGVVAATLLCALLGLMAYFMRGARESQNRSELLLAELEDARDEQAAAAALAERSRIAGELHDVLAHSLSGAAIQLQGARKLAEREEASGQMRSSIERAGELVRDGLASARQAVGALRGQELPGLAQLDSLFGRFREDMKVEVSFRVDGTPRAIPADAGMALYRGAQEAMTNVARHAPGAIAEVILHYAEERTTLIIENEARREPSQGGETLRDVGGGHGLAGMRERLQRVGGRVDAGPTGTGWRVELVVPR